ncbi:MAG: hypothetical protein WC111_10475 [Candidatus Cloacimonadaceae bacterium]
MVKIIGISICDIMFIITKIQFFNKTVYFIIKEKPNGVMMKYIRNLSPI